jgi:predicted GNAT family N-acyltransferase
LIGGDVVSISVEAPPIVDVVAAVSVRFARSPEEFSAVVELRRRVFRDEQSLVEGELTDTEDRHSYQALAVIPAGAIGTGRLTPPSVARPEAHIAWVATLPGFRGQGVGTAIMRALLSAADAAGMPVVTLSAQTHALDFYGRLGFLPFGERFLVRGIEHQRMARRRPR